MKTYEKIIAWQLAHRLVLEVYRLTATFPSIEQFGLTSQLRRAAVSIAANIVEGRARNTSKDFLNFLHIARASLEECEYHLLLAKDLAYISIADYDAIDSHCNELSATLNGLIRGIKLKTRL